MVSRPATSLNWTSRSSLVRKTDGKSVCLRIVDGGLLGIIFVAPMLFGARHNLGRFVLVALCTIVAVAWFVHQAMAENGKWTRTAAVGFLLAALGLLGFQLLPLPSDWIAVLAPRTAALLPIWSTDSPVARGDWQTLSLAPEATRLALATLVAYVLLFVTVSQRIQNFEDVQRLLRWIALSAIVMAGFGLVQYFTSNGLFFWFYEYPYTHTASRVKGSFPCQNHFAHFLVLGLAALSAWVLGQRNLGSSTKRRKSRSQAHSGNSGITIALALGLVLIGLAVLLSLSRGGALTMLVTVSVLGVLYYRGKLIAGNHFLATLGIGLAIVVLLSVYGYEQVSRRLDDFSEGSLAELDPTEGRRTIWSANLKATESGWQFGAGAGTHRYIAPVYLHESRRVEYTHAENGYLQVATENGLPGILLLVAGIGCCGTWCVRALKNCAKPKEVACAGAVTAALVASCVHSLFDFVWYIPACMALTILFAACALRLSQFSSRASPREAHSTPISRSSWIGLATLASVAGLWAAGSLVGPARAALCWDRYQMAEIGERATKQQSIVQKTALGCDNDRAALMYTEAMVENLEQVVYWHPDDCRAQLRLAGKTMELFDLRQASSDNRLSVTQIRDAAMASGFTSSGDLRAWLVRAFGENSNLLYKAYAHANRSIQLSPLQGKGYLILANLCFLEGKGRSGVGAYVEQALRVRPRDGVVLFAAGLYQLRSGRVDQAFQLWAQAYHDTGTHQTKITQLVAGQFPATLFLEIFQPDWKTLRSVWQQYQKDGSREDLEAIENYSRQLTAQSVAELNLHGAARVWRLLATMQTEIEMKDAALASLEAGFAANPSDPTIRNYLGRNLLERGEAKKAELHLRWCLARQPDNATLQRMLFEATKMRIEQMSNRPQTSTTY